MIAAFSDRRYGPFRRSLQIPRSVDAEKSEVIFKDGVLTVTLPRTSAEEHEDDPASAR